eukprot:TRINITY_DN4693_c1_g1_i1.p1 TRINITY_DN4693_c1_g1~~TRINITY_DN4693_c1_g1_i1.p1  ORF type:complete len:295 (+),score=68.16 TRINITY_DN4693_c1_g1_i1:77-886(+)
MEIFVQLEGHSAVPYTLQEQTTGRDIKADYCEKEGFELESCELHFEGTVASDDLPIRDTGIQEGETITVVVPVKIRAMRELRQLGLSNLVSLSGARSCLKSNDAELFALVMATGKVEGLFWKDLRAAVKIRAFRILEVFAANGVDLSSAGGIISTTDDPEIVEKLLELGADPNYCTGAVLVAPLGHVIRNGSLGSVAALIDYNADVDLHDPCGETPLCIAASRGNLPILQALLAAGANPDIPNSRGQLPIHVAIYHGCGRIVDALVEIS